VSSLPPLPSRAALEEVATGCRCQQARRRARALTKAYDSALEPSGISGTQFSLLVAVQLMGSPTVTALAAKVELDRTTLTRDLCPLARRGLVSVEPGEDRRTRVVRLTDDGGARVAEAYPRWREAQRAAAS